MSVQNKNLKETFFTLLLISSIIGVGVSYSKVYLFHFFLIFYILYWVYTNKFRVDLIFRKNINFSTIFFLYSIAWFFFFSFFSEKLLYSFQYLSFLLIGYSLSFVIVDYGRDERTLNRIINSLGIAVGVEMGISFLESLGIFRWPISAYSKLNTFFGKQNIIQTIATTQKIEDYIRTVPTGFHWNPNNLSALLVIAFPFFLLHRKKWLSIAGSILIISLIVCASARACYLALGLITFLVIVLQIRKIPASALISVFLLVAISSNIFFLAPNSFLKINEIHKFSFRILHLPSPVDSEEHAEHEEENSMDVRMQLNAIGLDALKQNVWTGIGAGNAKYVLEKRGGVGKNKITNLHNFWLEILVEGGVIYMLIYITWYIFLIFQLWVNFRSHQVSATLRNLSLACLLSLTGFVIAAIGPSSVIYFLPMYVLFGLAISIIIVGKISVHEGASVS